MASSPAKLILHFNPRSREGSDNGDYGIIFLLDISIHAPAKGATNYHVYTYNPKKFQSTLPRRERHCYYLGYWQGVYFNPRSREGSDIHFFTSSISSKHFNPRSREGSDGWIEISFESLKISIHAPAKGATISKFTRQVIPIDFNPRSREGSDNLSLLTDLVQQYFNPRSREGSDTYTLDIAPVPLGFQSTLPRRERLSFS